MRKKTKIQNGKTPQTPGMGSDGNKTQTQCLISISAKGFSRLIKISEKMAYFFKRPSGHYLKLC